MQDIEVKKLRGGTVELLLEEAKLEDWENMEFLIWLKLVQIDLELGS